MKWSAVTLIFLFSVSGVLAQSGGVPPGPPSVEVAGTVEVDVVNSDLSHLGQHIQDHVTLVNAFQDSTLCGGTSSFENNILVRVSPDGTPSNVEFEVPAGRNLVITDVTWRTPGLTTLSGTLTVGNTLVLGLSVGSTEVISSAETIDTDNGTPGASVHLVSGAVVGPGANICPSAAQLRPNGFAAVRLSRVTIKGYLIDAPQ